jgi:hypothetical protein
MGRLVVLLGCAEAEASQAAEVAATWPGVGEARRGLLSLFPLPSSSGYLPPSKLLTKARATSESGGARRVTTRGVRRASRAA